MLFERPRFSCACVSGKSPWQQLKLVRDRPDSAWKNCPYPLQGETDDQQKCLEVLAWEQEEIEKTGFAERVADFDLRLKLLKAQLEAYRLYEVVDVSRPEFTGTVAMCEARVRMVGDLPHDDAVSDDVRARWAELAANLTMFQLAGQSIGYQVVRDAETGRPLVRITRGLN